MQGYQRIWEGSSVRALKAGISSIFSSVSTPAGVSCGCEKTVKRELTAEGTPRSVFTKLEGLRKETTRTKSDRFDLG
jgi:hypothetical protein